MTTQTKRLEFEQKLTQLKQAHHNDEITIDEYIEQAGSLRFDDEAAGQTWWLDPESESWYVAPLGTENFEEYIAPAEAQSTSDETEPPQPEPEPVPTPPEPEDEPKLQPNQPEIESVPLPETQFEVQPESSPPETISEPQPEPEPTSPKIKSKIVLSGAAIIIIVILSGLGGIWLFLDNKQTPTVTAIAVQSTPTTNPISFTETPTPIPSPTSIPTATFTPIPPSATSTPSPTSSATVTSSATPSATDTPIPTDTPSSLPVTDTPTPIFTPTPPLAETEEPGFNGKLAYPEFDDKAQTYSIKVVDLSTGEIIIEIPQASQPTLSLDGSKSAYISWAPDKIGLYSISLVDGAPNTLSDKLEAQRPQWSFNGRNKVFEYKKESQEDVRFSDETGLAGIQMGRTPTWSPDGRVTLFAGQGGQYGLAVINADGTNLKFLTNNTEDVAPAVSPDGQWVAYTSTDDMWLISIDGGTPTRLTTSPSREGIPTWSPDGQWIAFATEVDGQWSVQVIHPDGSGQQKLLDIPGGLGGTVASEAYRYQGWLHESISWSR